MMKLSELSKTGFHHAKEKRHGNSRTANPRTWQGVGGKSALEGHKAQLQRRRRRPLAWLDANRAYACKAWCCFSVVFVADRCLCQFAWGFDRQSGAATGESRLEVDLPVRLAGCRRCEPGRRNVSGPIALSGQFGADGRQAHQ